MCQLCIYSQPCGVRSSLQHEPKSQFHSSRFDHVQPILAQKWIDFWFIALSETRMTNWLTDRLAYTGTSNKMKANTKNEETKRWRSESKKKTEWNNTKLQPFYNGLSVRITESLKIERARQPSNPLIVKFLFSPNASTIEENRTEQSRAPLWSSPHSYTRTLIHLIYPSIPSW